MNSLFFDQAPVQQDAQLRHRVAQAKVEAVGAGAVHSCG